MPFYSLLEKPFRGNESISLFSLDFSPPASLLGDSLNPMEAQIAGLSPIGKSPKRRRPPSYFFCHLGPPFENDALAIESLTLRSQSAELAQA